MQIPFDRFLFTCRFRCIGMMKLSISNCSWASLDCWIWRNICPESFTPFFYSQPSLIQDDPTRPLTLDHITRWYTMFETILRYSYRKVEGQFADLALFDLFIDIYIYIFTYVYFGYTSTYRFAVFETKSTWIHCCAADGFGDAASNTQQPVGCGRFGHSNSCRNASEDWIAWMRRLVRRWFPYCF